MITCRGGDGDKAGRGDIRELDRDRSVDAGVTDGKRPRGGPDVVDKVLQVAEDVTARSRDSIGTIDDERICSTRCDDTTLKCEDVIDGGIPTVQIEAGRVVRPEIPLRHRGDCLNRRAVVFDERTVCLNVDRAAVQRQ